LICRTRKSPSISAAKSIIVSRGGIGKPIDEVALNQALFEKEGVEIIGVIINKVLPEKVDYIADFARRGLKRKGLELLGVIPHQPMLSSPTVESIREELDAEVLNTPPSMHGLVDDVVVGAMSAPERGPVFQARRPAHHARRPGRHPGRRRRHGNSENGRHRPHRRDSNPATACSAPAGNADSGVAGPGRQLSSRLQGARPHRQDRPADAEKISLIRDIVAKHVNVKKILESI
jgi:hypothetical protein